MGQTLETLGRGPLLPVASHERTVPQRSVAEVVREVYQRFPRLAPLAVEVVDSRGTRPDVRGGLEFYPPDEAYNPKPGRNTIELFDPKLAGQTLHDALAGDMLHGLPSVDPEFAALRQAFKKTLTPEQKAFDKKVYETAREDHDTFDSWMERSWLDAYIRGYLFPDQNDEWRKSGVYTPEQQAMLEQMRGLLTQPARNPNTLQNLGRPR